MSELAQLCQVSEIAIHRDLEELERQGAVRKFRGGSPRTDGKPRSLVPVQPTRARLLNA
ncbi:DeoR family transcriptional regulator [Phytoactinopolyspora endophytica]|uniref:DeoR family transcriptional regulator n=1 Tax=Phytoactinopolyspora endophytica TaxID=1642495 RepID=UPI00197C472D